MKKGKSLKRFALSLTSAVLVMAFATIAGSALSGSDGAMPQTAENQDGDNEAATIFMLGDRSKAAFWADADDDGATRFKATGGTVNVATKLGNDYLRWTYTKTSAAGVELKPSDNIYTGTNTRAYVLEVSVKKGEDFDGMSASGRLNILTATLGGSKTTFFTADKDGVVYFGGRRVALLSDSAWTRLAIAVNPVSGQTAVYVDGVETDCVGSVSKSALLSGVLVVSTDNCKADVCFDNVGMYFSDKPFVLTGKVSITEESTTVNASSQSVHRPIPTEFSTGNGYDDLIYYDEVEVKSVDEFLADYAGTVVYSIASKQVSTSAWTAATLDGAKQDDLIYVSFKMTKGKATLTVGSVQQVCETSDASKDFGVVLSCPSDSAKVKLVASGSAVTVSDFKIVNYGSGLSADDVVVACSGVDTLNEDAAWRKEAWNDIQKYRKDDFTVKIVDENGNAVTGAQISMDMFESEFQWGSTNGLGKNRLQNSEGEPWRINIDTTVSMFNTNVSSGFHVANSPTVDTLIQKAQSRQNAFEGEGMRYLKGHSVLNAYALAQLTKAGYLKGDVSLLDAMKQRIRDVFDTCNKTTGIFCNEWDFFNEVEITGSDVKPSILGGPLTADHFRESLAEARKYGTWQITGKLYYNAAYQGDSDEGSSNNAKIIQLLDWFKKEGIEFDGYGMEQHLNGIWDMNDLAASIDEFIAHADGKEIKVTEFDLGGQNITEAQKASFMRDYILLIYSRPEMVGLVTWTPVCYGSNVTAQRSLLYDVELPKGVQTIADMTEEQWEEYAWRAMLGADQWSDVIYNKLWTRESGTTDANGKMTVNGFFGCYDVTVKVGDKQYTASVDFLENGVREYVITIPAQSN